MKNRSKLLATVVAIGSIASAQSQVVRNTTPPNPLNPAGYLLDPAGGPMAGNVWTPSVDDSTFSPPPVAPALFFVGVSTGPAPFDIPFGSTFLLVDVLPPNPIFAAGPVVGSGGPTPFPLPIPLQCGLMGSSFSTQALLIDGAASLSFANAIDIIIGSGPAGLYSLAQNAPSLIRLDPATGASLSSVTITLPGSSVVNGNALAKHPFTGELFAVLKIAGGPTPPGAQPRKSRKNRPGSGPSSPGPVTGRALVTICPLTGDAELVLDLKDAFAGIAFDQAGTLWGVVGDGGLAPNSLWIIDTAGSGMMINVATLGNGLDGEMLAFNSSDNLLYHGSGNNGFTGSANVFETIDPLNPTAPPLDIPLSPTSLLNGDETNAISAYDPSIGGFWWAAGCCTFGGFPNWTGELFIGTPTGVGTFVGPLDHASKGLATLP